MQDSGTLILIGAVIVIFILIVFRLGKGRGKAQKKKDIRKKLDV